MFGGEVRGGAAKGRREVRGVDVLVQLCVLVQEEDLDVRALSGEGRSERERGEGRKDLVFGAGVENSFHHRPDHVDAPVVVDDIERAQSAFFEGICSDSSKERREKGGRKGGNLSG